MTNKKEKYFHHEMNKQVGIVHRTHRTKIVATVGPACESYDQLLELAKAGVNVFRLNFSHGSHENKAEIILIGKYTFDFINQSLTLAGETKRITEKESDILQYLSNHRNHIIKREEVLKELWGENDYFFGRSLDVFITKIRKYLKDDPAISIENVFGVGFIFNVPVD